MPGPSPAGDGRRDHVPPEEILHQASLLKTGAELRGHGERILVTDDEEVLALMVERALVVLGYVAEFTTLPAKALEMVRADPQRFDLVLTDQTMPEMTGLDLAGRILEIRPGMPIVMMTGFTAPLMTERVAAAGVRELLLKPMTLQSLGAAVHAALSGASGSHQGSNSPESGPTAGPRPGARPPQLVGA
jgi:CheY-like chemotaxis protein